MKTGLLLLSLCLVACGKSSENTAPDTPLGGVEGQIVKAESALPVCDSSRTGALVYVKDSSVFKTCEGGKWATVDLTGDKGAQGTPGATGASGDQGPQGNQGVPGTPMKITKSEECYRLATTVTSLRYKRITFTSGDVVVQCRVMGNFENENTHFYAANTAGAANSFCSASYDSELPESGGRYEFRITNDVREVRYLDTGAPTNGTNEDFAPTNCVTTGY